jgi:hypothetical protein
MMQLSTRELLIRAKARQAPRIPVDYEALLRAMFGPSRDGVARGPVPTQRKFIESKARNKAFKGMAGVAKTTSLCASMFLRALFQPNFQGAIGRLDYNKLMGTTYKAFEAMVNRVNPDLIIDRDKTPPMKLYIQQPGGIGIAQIDFIGLKEYPGSYEWHRVGVDEADECDMTVIEGLKTRLRAPCPPEYQNDYGVDMVFNPPDEVHWIYQACTGKNAQGKQVQEPTFTLFEPQYGENDGNLPANYSEENFRGLPQDMLMRLKYGQWGASFPGEGVFRGSFNTSVHIRPDLRYEDSQPLLRFWDFGFGHPACIWAQMDEHMRLRVLREVLGENIEAKAFVEHCKAVTTLHFPQAGACLDFGDPAAKQKKDTGSTLEVLAGQGVELIYMDGMSIEEGLRRTRFLLEQLWAGEPALTISKKGAPLTCRMFQGGYYKHKTTGRPVKDGFYDHLADALRYGVTNLYDPLGRPMALPETAASNYVARFAQGADVPDTIEYDGRDDRPGWDR